MNKWLEARHQGGNVEMKHSFDGVLSSKPYSLAAVFVAIEAGEKKMSHADAKLLIEKSVKTIDAYMYGSFFNSSLSDQLDERLTKFGEVGGLPKQAEDKIQAHLKHIKEEEHFQIFKNKDQYFAKINDLMDMLSRSPYDGLTELKSKLDCHRLNYRESTNIHRHTHLDVTTYTTAAIDLMISDRNGEHIVIDVLTQLAEHFNVYQIFSGSLTNEGPSDEERQNITMTGLSYHIASHSSKHWLIDFFWGPEFKNVWTAKDLGFFIESLQQVGHTEDLIKVLDSDLTRHIASSMTED